MPIPFRGHAPAFPGPAPTGPWGPSIPRPTVPGGLAAWRPSPAALRGAAGRILSPRNLRNFGVGGMIGSLLADYAIMQANAHLALWLNGFVVARVCDPKKGMDGWFSSYELSTCLTDTGGGVSPRALPAYVGGLGPNPGIFIRFVGLNIETPFGARFYAESRDYAIPTFVGEGPRPRPFFGPIIPVLAPPRVGALAPPGSVPYGVRPWPVWGGQAPPGTGVDGGYAPPGVGGGVQDSVIPGRPISWEFPSVPGVRPVTPAVPGVRAVPVPGTRETKVGVNTPAGQLFLSLMRAREAVSEFDDLVETMFKALPKSVQRSYGKDLGSMSLALWENWDRMDFKLWLRNLAANHLEDELIGRFFQMKAAARNAVWGNHMGSLGTNGPGFEDFTKAVSEMVDQLADDFFGEGSDEHPEDRIARLDRERRRRLRDRANQ